VEVGVDGMESMTEWELIALVYICTYAPVNIFGLTPAPRSEKAESIFDKI